MDHVEGILNVSAVSVFTRTLRVQHREDKHRAQHGKDFRYLVNGLDEGRILLSIFT